MAHGSGRQVLLWMRYNYALSRGSVDELMMRAAHRDLLEAIPLQPANYLTAVAKPAIRAPSHTLDERVHHPLLAGLVELNGELVAIHRDHVAVTEFLMEDAIAG